MAKKMPTAAATAALVIGFAGAAMAQSAMHPFGSNAADAGRVIIPATNLAPPGSAGIRAQTNIRIMVPKPKTGVTPALPSLVGPPVAGYAYETPWSISCLYGLTDRGSPACNPNTANAIPTARGKKGIAIVSAFDAPTVVADLRAFAKQFGLATPVTPNNIEVLFSGGVRPSGNLDWGLQSAMAVEWAYAMAPKAKIFLVEAPTDATADLLRAVDIANSALLSVGGGQVSMNWSTPEFSTEATRDTHFATSQVTYFAPTGDEPGPKWPSTSAKVVAVGGSTTSRDPDSYDFLGSEASWDDAGGGPSAYIPIPSYQATVSDIADGMRITPDVVADANPNTGVWVYYRGGWFILGGTSVATSIVAGIINDAGGARNTATLQAMLYANLDSEDAYRNNFHDIKRGYCGPYAGYLVTRGWDFCTGIGSLKGLAGK